MKPGRAYLQKLGGPGLTLMALALLATFPLYASVYSMTLLTDILMFVVLALSWALFSAPTGYISLAPAAFFGVGIYTSAILGRQWPLPLTIALGGAISFCLALLVGALTLRLKGIYFAMFTFGLVELIKHFWLWFEIRFTGTRGRFVAVVDQQTIYFTMLASFVLLLLTTHLIRRSRWGLALRSIGECEEAAAHIGVNVNALKTITFAISAIFMGAAGAIIATRWTYVDPYIAFNPLYSFMAVLMALFGGMGHPYGPVLGAAIFAYLEEVLLTRFPYYYMLIFGVVLIITVLYLPEGLIGLMMRIRRRVVGGPDAPA
ncbi:MAG: branched-chain amino acid ABC transporter permease [Anaerolineae bacterium]|nr:branched-chain amino acid ABC transporter permease [Anaerolineae bacterium]